MAKMTSLSGAVTGKLAGNVYSVSAGQQIVRAYQPNVANPNTELQVENRTKFKLASQLAAAVSPVLAIPKQGLVSGRNQFVKASIGAITYALGQATVLLNRLQLTNSNVILPAVIASAGENNRMSVRLQSDATILGVSKVVYAVFIQSSGEQLQLRKTLVVSEAGSSGHFDGDMLVGAAPIFYVYAYGIIEDENSLLAKYEGYKIDNAEFVASLISSRSGVATGMKTTTTSYTTYSPA